MIVGIRLVSKDEKRASIDERISFLRNDVPEMAVHRY